MQKIDPKVTEKTFFPDFAPCPNYKHKRVVGIELLCESDSILFISVYRISPNYRPGRLPNYNLTLLF